LEGVIPSWSCRVVNGLSKVFWLRSNAWPGLHIVTSANADRIVTQYYGWGIKTTTPLEWPPLPEPKRKKKPVEEEEEEEEEVGEPKEEEEGEGEAVVKTRGGSSKQSAPTVESESGTYDGSTYDSSY
jgi:hypothetical protein